MGVWQNPVTQWTPENVDSGRTLCPGVLFGQNPHEDSGSQEGKAAAFPLPWSPWLQLPTGNRSLKIPNGELQK